MDYSNVTNVGTSTMDLREDSDLVLNNNLAQLKDLKKDCIDNIFVREQLAERIADIEEELKRRETERKEKMSCDENVPDLTKVPGRVVYIGKDCSFVISVLGSPSYYRVSVLGKVSREWMECVAIDSETLAALKQLPDNPLEAKYFESWYLRDLMDKRKDASNFSLFVFDVICSSDARDKKINIPHCNDVVFVQKIVMPSELDNYFCCFRYVVLARNVTQAKATLFSGDLKQHAEGLYPNVCHSYVVYPVDKIYAALRNKPYFLSNTKIAGIENKIQDRLYGDLSTGGVPGGIPHNGKGPVSV